MATGQPGDGSTLDFSNLCNERPLIPGSGDAILATHEAVVSGVNRKPRLTPSLSFAAFRWPVRPLVIPNLPAPARHAAAEGERPCSQCQSCWRSTDCIPHASQPDQGRISAFAWSPAAYRGCYATSNSPAAPIPPPTHIEGKRRGAKYVVVTISACPVMRAPDMP